MATDGVIDQITNMVTDIIEEINPQEDKDEEEIEPFTNMFNINRTCMFLIILYVFLFLYKKEVMNMVKKILK